MNIDDYPYKQQIENNKMCKTVEYLWHFMSPFEHLSSGSGGPNKVQDNFVGWRCGLIIMIRLR